MFWAQPANVLTCFISCKYPNTYIHRTPGCQHYRLNRNLAGATAWGTASYAFLASGNNSVYWHAFQFVKLDVPLQYALLGHINMNPCTETTSRTNAGFLFCCMLWNVYKSGFVFPIYFQERINKPENERLTNTRLLYTILLLHSMRLHYISTEIYFTKE